MKKGRKVLLYTAMTLAVLGAGVVPISSAEPTKVEAAAITYYSPWKYDTKTWNGNKLGRSYYIGEQRVDYNGEQVEFTTSDERTTTLEVNASADIKKIISIGGGYSWGITKGKSITKVSPQLKKGQLIEAYRQTQYAQYIVKIKRSVHSFGKPVKYEYKTYKVNQELKPYIRFVILPGPRPIK